MVLQEQEREFPRRRQHLLCRLRIIYMTTLQEAASYRVIHLPVAVRDVRVVVRTVKKRLTKSVVVHILLVEMTLIFRCLEGKE